VVAIRAGARAAIARWEPLDHTEVLKKTLMSMAIDADIVLDLHCDNEALLHLYTGSALAGQVSPLAALLGARVLLLSDASGGAPFGMNEEVIPFVLIFVPLALALGYDTAVVGVSIPFLGSQVDFGAAFLNPFNIGIAQGIAGVPVFSEMGYRLVVWAAATLVTIAFLMWYAARVKRNPALSPTFVLDQARRQEHPATLSSEHMSGRHAAVLSIFALTLGAMVIGVVKFDWFIDEIVALFLAMAIVVGLAGRLGADTWQPRSCRE
jgi:uncharacterized ion transporter superfamily protein YfcC